MEPRDLNATFTRDICILALLILGKVSLCVEHTFEDVYTNDDIQMWQHPILRARLGATDTMPIVAMGAVRV